jgi:hypothetical protein
MKICSIIRIVVKTKEIFLLILKNVIEKVTTDIIKEAKKAIVNHGKV